MEILILGGTVFLGRHLVDAALARGHEVTLFNRGRSNPGLFEDVERLRGDRRGDLAALRGRRWNAVIDTCGYVPSEVRGPARLLAGAADHYTFVSTISVYRDFDPAGIDETAAVETITEEELARAEEIEPEDGAKTLSYGAMYGALKARCEQAAEEAMPGRLLRVRPGLIVGPHDPSGRFDWWVRRVARGGEVLAPGRPSRRIRVIDARDLAAWIVRRVEAGATGVANATGPPEGSTMGRYLNACRAASASGARFTWVDEAFLLEREVGPWMELPLWLPEDQNGFFEVRNDRAVAAGLAFRPLAETVADTLAWLRSASPAPSPETGLAPAAEARLLAAWAGRLRASGSLPRESSYDPG